MRRQSVMALAIAVVLGLVAVFLANTYWTARDKQAESAMTGSVRVAVAAVPLDYGVAVTPDKIRFASYPAKSLPPGVFRSIEEAVPQGKARIALRPLQQNQLLIATDLTGAGENASISALLPEGKRAASVRINDVSGVAGFIKPNDTVDVLITRQALGQARDGQVTDVLIQNVRVIATDQQAENKDAAPTVAKVATLEVSPLDAQKLALGQQVGQLSLVLRKPGEENNIPYVDTVSLDDLRSGTFGSAPRPTGMQAPGTAAIAAVNLPSVPRAAPRPRATVRRTAPVVAKPRSDSVEIVRGTTTQSYEVSRNGQ
jgi:pilus assembly protein CpaB